MFGRRKRMDNAVSMVTKLPPAHSTINHYGTNWPLIIAVSVACLVVLLPILWFFLVHVIERAGYRRPEEQLAQWVLLILFLSVLLWFAGLLLRVIGNWVLELRRESFAHQQAMKELDQRLMEAEITRNALPAPSESRLTEEDSKLRVNLISVMTRAYDRLKSGEYIHKEPRPWSQDQVYTNPPSDSTRMRYAKTGKVREWLAQHEMIVGEPGSDQVNTFKYPTVLDSIQEIERRFTLPVVVVQGQTALPSSANNGYVYTGFE